MNENDPIGMQELAIQWTAAQPVVAAFIASVVPRHHDAEDILQRTAAALVAKCEKYDRNQPFANWAIGIARIEVLRLRQERHRERTTFDTEAIEAVAAAFEHLRPELDGLKSTLDECIAKLRGGVRDIFNLHYVDGLRPTVIADRMGRTTSAIFVALHRGRESLRLCMEKQLHRTGGAL